MHLHTRNVNSAFRQLVTVFSGYVRDQRHLFALDDGYRPIVVDVPLRKSPSRYGDVILIDEPVIITYEKPLERVLFNSARDANPFSLLYEALWMLAGRNDVAPLAYYTKRFQEFSDDGKTLNGAYGYRWRHASTLNARLRSGDTSLGSDLATMGIEATEVDQLALLIDHLRNNPHSRRAVLQHWNVEDDLLKIEGSKDVCCNLSVMFSLREEGLTIERFLGAEHVKTEGSVATMIPPPARRFLDMTVTNRSNDLIWGLLGANYVTFSILQEYVAAHLGAEVGRYHHFSNNLHVYTAEDRWKPEEWLADKPPEDEYISHAWAGSRLVPLVKDPTAFDRELPVFVDYHKDGKGTGNGYSCLTEPFLRDVAYPMLTAFHWYKRIRTRAHHDEGDICDALSNVAADDWRIAAEGWLKRRMQRVS